VPGDVAVVGFDDQAIATSTTPQLTSVRQPIEEMGREMARLLVEAVDAPDPVPRRVILATELIRRASSAGRRSP
jgi:DNA-binding LacI/PurR family transcriptional regulator